MPTDIRLQPRTKATPEQEAIIKQLLASGLVSQAKLAAASYNIYCADISSPQTESWLEKFITVCPKMERVKTKCRILSNTDDTVLITGESGTGKELLANSLHGDRSGKFLGVNCGAFSDDLLESELFGHVMGSFTGSVKDRTGIFQAAKDGTVFLDEIGELPLIAQAALLRTLQNRTIRKVGANVEEVINCRIVCATWHNLEEEVTAGKFREDLYYRLSRVVLQLTPLRERPDDAALILTTLDTIGSISIGKKQKICYGNNIKGNVRMLENLVRRVELFGQEELENL